MFCENGATGYSVIGIPNEQYSKHSKSSDQSDSIIIIS